MATTTITSTPSVRHRELPEMRPEMLRVDLRKSERADFRAEVGRCLQLAASLLGWSLKELAGRLGRDERQVSRWIKGDERVQVDVVFDVEELRQPFVYQLSRLSGARERVQIDFEFRKVG